MVWAGVGDWVHQGAILAAQDAEGQGSHVGRGNGWPATWKPSRRWEANGRDAPRAVAGTGGASGG
jgi:hypothetical protein